MPFAYLCDLVRLKGFNQRFLNPFGLHGSAQQGNPKAEDVGDGGWWRAWLSIQSQWGHTWDWLPADWMAMVSWYHVMDVNAAPSEQRWMFLRVLTVVHATKRSTESTGSLWTPWCFWFRNNTRWQHEYVWRSNLLIGLHYRTGESWFLQLEQGVADKRWAERTQCT